MRLQERVFCSRYSNASAEMVYATAPYGKYYIFIPAQKANWPKIIGKCNSLADRIESLHEIRVRAFVRLYDPQNAPSKVLLFSESGVSTSSEPILWRLEGADTADLDRTAHLMSKLLKTADDAEDFNTGINYLFICTDGRRDACCAKFGYSFIKRVAPFKSGPSIFQCSHLGGDRFAATGILFPAGDMFGRLDSIREVLPSDLRNPYSFIHKFYRGRVFESRLMQYARYFLWTELRIDPSKYILGSVDLDDRGEEGSIRIAYTIGNQNLAARYKLRKLNSLVYPSCTEAAGDHTSIFTKWVVV